VDWKEVLQMAVSQSGTRDVRDVLGACHFYGDYAFSGEDLLNDGADQLLALGSRAIKCAFRENMANYYAVQCDWPEVHDLVELAQVPHFRALFARPFTSYVLMTYAPGRDLHYFLRGMSPADIEWEGRRVYDLAAYLLTEYAGSGKTFVLTNWESDWALTPPRAATDPTPSCDADPGAIRGMIDWFNARQDAVDLARRDVGTRDVMVAHAAEVNLVARAIDGETRVTNDVLPYTHCDLYSYSAWDTLCGDISRFRAALDYIAHKAPPSALFGDRPVYVGEFGAPVSQYGAEGQLEIVRHAMDTGLDWGCPYLLYWALYGPDYGMIPPDGSHTPVRDHFAGLLRAAL
jgi:hypothetical protein